MAPFDDLILAGRESPALEHKQSAQWEELRIALIRTVLGMANTRGGGNIVIGMTELDDKTFSADGMSEEHWSGFPPDEDFQAKVNGFAEPFIEPRLERHEHEGRRFLVFTAPEFEYEPILCTKTEGQRLREGALYVRSTRTPETVEARMPTDMRALMRLATDKALGREIERLRVLGLLPRAQGASDTGSEAFARQIEDV